MEFDREALNRLSAEYAVATAHYAWSVAELNRLRAVVSQEEYERFYRVVEESRMNCERLRSSLQKFQH